jgi:hypothetical protein
MYQFQWISYEVYNFSIVIPLIVLAVIFERMRRATRGLRDDQSSKEIVYWQWQDIKRHGRGSTDM